MKKQNIVAVALVVAGIVSVAVSADNTSIPASPARMHFVWRDLAGSGTLAIEMGKPRVASMGTNGLETVTYAGWAANITKPFRITGVTCSGLLPADGTMVLQRIGPGGVVTPIFSQVMTNSYLFASSADVILYPGDTLYVPADTTATNGVFSLDGLALD